MFVMHETGKRETATSLWREGEITTSEPFNWWWAKLASQVLVKNKASFQWGKQACKAKTNKQKKQKKAQGSQC